MPEQTLTSFEALTREQKERFLGQALSQLTLESFEAVLLQQRSMLSAMSNNGKVQLAFRMGISPIAHAYRPGGSGQLHWELPQVPEHLRPLVYATSRLISECQAALAALVQGRGDFTRALGLLNPAAIQEMADRFSKEMQDYATQLREASGRVRKPSQQATSRRAGAEIKPAVAPEAPPAPKPKRASTRGKQQPDSKDESTANEDVTPPAPADEVAVAGGEPTPIPEVSDVPESDTDAPAEQSTEIVSNFGFDVLALAAGAEVKTAEGDAEA